MTSATALPVIPDEESASDNNVDESATVPTTDAPTDPAQQSPGTGPDQTAAVPPTLPPFHGVDPAPLLARIADLEAALAGTQRGADVIDLSDQRALQDVGIYRYHHPLESAAAYKERLRSLESRINDVIRSSRAILAADMFTFDGSLVLQP